MTEDRETIKLLLDEDLSPRIAQILCEEDMIDAIAVRDRGHLSATDYEVLDLAFDEDRILVTANVRDFEKFANLREVHNGIIFICQGDLNRCEQLTLLREAIKIIRHEIGSGRDIINRALYMGGDGERYFRSLSSNLNQ